MKKLVITLLFVFNAIFCIGQTVVQSNNIRIHAIEQVINYNNFDTTQKDLRLSIYNDLLTDFLKRKNLGVEAYTNNKLSFIGEYSFSNNNLFGHTYDIDIWHIGMRKYFNDNYKKLFIEAYMRGGYFDTNLFSEKGYYGVLYGAGFGLGYKFNISKNWRLYPLIRFGFDNIYFNNYYSKQGNIIISFDKYINGKIVNGDNDIYTDIDNTEQVYIVNSKNINSNFYQNCYNAKWFGPTYICFILQRDFYLTRKNNK